MTISNLLDWAVVLGYISVTVFIMYRVFVTGND